MVVAPTNGTPSEAVTAFLADLRERLQYIDREGREAQLAEPLRDLVRALARLEARPGTDTRGQAQEPGVGRPDFSVKEGPLLIGHIETKPTGKGANPSRFTDRHDRDQWERFKRLPNLLYTDGLEWSLYRSGELARLTGDRPARVAFNVDLDDHGPFTVDPAAVADLRAIVAQLIGWTPIAPRSLSDLAVRLAPLCATLRDAVEGGLELEGSALSLVTNDVRTTLFPDADNKALADAFAQTSTYSMLLARSEGAVDLHAATVEETLRDQHAVLARVVRILLDPDAEHEVEWAVDVVRRQIEVVDFERLSQGRGRETWLYFYEEFLAAYDPRLRDSRGVYYTPKEVIHAQVAMAEDVLVERFGRDLGFAADGVVVLDPAVGTGSYPLAVMNRAAERAREFGDGAVPAAVTELADRLHAFELLIGAYAVAHLRLTEAIRDHGGTPPRDGVHVYLTDTLSSPYVEPPYLGAVLEPLVEEHQRARRLKDTVPIVVCLGNPPYDREQRDVDATADRRRGGGWVRFGDQDHQALMEDLLAPLRRAGEGGHAKNLFNSYVYFWRWALWKTFEHDDAATERTGGIVSFITASSFINGPGFAYLRRLMRTLCDDVYVLDLGGDLRGTRRTQNVFDIQTGVAITVAVRDPGAGERAGRVHYADWSEGTRGEKLVRLAEVERLGDLPWKPASSEPTASFRVEGEGDYFQWPKLGDLFPWHHSGVQVKRTWPIAPNDETLRDRWARLLAAPAEQRAELFGSTRDRKLDSEPSPLWGKQQSTPALSKLDSDDADVRARARALPDDRLVDLEFRSFDRERLILDPRLGDYLKPVLWRLHSDRQMYLCSLMGHPLARGPAVTLASASPPDLHFYRGSYGAADAMPLFRDMDAGAPNITAGVLEVLSQRLGRQVGPEDLVAYVLGTMGTGAYAELFERELGTPGPHLPMTAAAELFEALAEKGRRLGFLQSRGARFARAGWRLPAGSARILTAPPETPPRTVTYDEGEQTIRLGTGRVGPVTTDVWNFQVSGYAVVQEWIKRRLAEPRGRQRSQLDQIRKVRWTFPLQRELVGLLAIVEEIVDELTPACQRLLDDVLDSELVMATDLPEPTDDERAPPAQQRSRPSLKPQKHAGATAAAGNRPRRTRQRK